VKLTEDSLCHVLRHSRIIESFLLPCATCQCTPAKLDRFFTLADFSSLVWIDITDSKLSTLCFLYGAPNLEIVNLSGCRNLIDDDCLVLKESKKLEQIYVSFTKILPETLQIICENKPLISVDACGVKLNIDNCRNILQNTRGELVHLHISLSSAVTKEGFKQEILDLYLNTSVTIYSHE
jgi:hypothetical protein